MLWNKIAVCEMLGDFHFQSHRAQLHSEALLRMVAPGAGFRGVTLYGNYIQK